MTSNQVKPHRCENCFSERIVPVIEKIWGQDSAPFNPSEAWEIYRQFGYEVPDNCRMKLFDE